MSNKIDVIRDVNGTRFGIYEPGNGTAYRAIAVPWHISVYCGVLGRVSDGWLIVSCNTGRAYLVRENAFLVDDYIREKIGGLPTDYPYMGDLIRELIGYEAD